MPVIKQYCVGKPDAGKLARPVWRGLGGNVHRKLQRAALPPYAVQFLKNGGDVFTLQRLMGHNSLEMVNRYLSLSQTDLEDAYRKNSPVDRMRL